MGHRFKPVVKIINDLCERHFVNQNGTRSTKVFGTQVNASALCTHLHQIADVAGGNQEADFYEWFAELFDLAIDWNLRGIVDDNNFATTV